MKNQYQKKDKNKKIILIIIIIIILIGLYFIYSGKSASNLNQNSNKNGSTENNTIVNQDSSQIANPASKYCIDNGGSLNIKSDPEGNQYGECTLESGKVCEEWAFLRGECSAV